MGEKVITCHIHNLLLSSPISLDPHARLLARGNERPEVATAYDDGACASGADTEI